MTRRRKRVRLRVRDGIGPDRIGWSIGSVFSVQPPPMQNSNTEAYIHRTIDDVMRNVRMLRSAPGVQARLLFPAAACTICLDFGVL